MLLKHYLERGVSKMELSRRSGTFATESREARTVRNPRTGESVAVAASRTPSFKAGKPLWDRLRKGGPA